MGMNLLLRKLHIDKKEFVTARELKEYCNKMNLDYQSTIRYFIKQRYFTRILKGIFYVKSPEELELGTSKHNHLELAAKGVELKNVRNWYFGLHTALKLNNMTHEHFAIEEVVSDSLFRAKLVTIAGYKFKFIKLSPSLLNFGIKGRGLIRYSSPEKTILDFIYLWRYNGTPEEKIVADVSGWSKGTSVEKLRAYAKKYPKTVAKTIDRVVG